MFEYTSEYAAESYDWQHASDDLWAMQTPFQELADEAWAASDYEAMHEALQAMYTVDDLSQEAYDYSWEVWEGPVNTEGYTAMQAAEGYSSMDTSFIEPASAAGSCSMISDYSAESSL